METFHNPDRFMSDLRQILSQGRKRVGLLVGAGAPMSIKIDNNGAADDKGNSLIPGVDTLTSKVIDSLTGEQQAAAMAIRNELRDKANIESILSRVRLLQQALGDVKVNSLDGGGYKALGESICKEIGNLVGVKLPAGRNAYSDLVAWISGTNRAHPVEIFTTNYDLLFEESFEGVRAPYFDGFTGGSRPFFDAVSVASNDLPSRWTRLWKLHGSLGWAVEDDVVVRSGGRAASQLVYPDHLKYDLTQKQPYSALFERLKQFLLSPDTVLLAAGFSFRDAHICAVIDEALAMNSNSCVLAFQFQNIESEKPACKLAFNRPNLSVYAADGAVIGGVKGGWRLGESPKNWEQVRKTFWASRQPDSAPCFSLGDFSSFARFCALSQSTDIRQPQAPETDAAETEIINEVDK